MSVQIRFGQIVWAEVADSNGIRKARPVIVVTKDDRISSSSPLEVVAISSFLPNPLPDDHILLPWHAQGHSKTGLNRKSAAICGWQTRIAMSDILNVVGLVPDRHMLEIMKKVESTSPP